VFGYMIEGEMLFELKAKPLGLFGLEKHSGNPAEKWVHYSDANNRNDIGSKFVVTMMCTPGKPMREFLDEEELVQRRRLRTRLSE
jgi:hypothetical protein